MGFNPLNFLLNTVMPADTLSKPGKILGDEHQETQTPMEPGSSADSMRQEQGRAGWEQGERHGAQLWWDLMALS